MKKVIDRGKRSKTLSEVKLVENISKNPHSVLKISPMQIEVLQSFFPARLCICVIESKSIKSSKFVSHRVRISGQFDSRKDSHSAKVERRPQIFVKLSFRELCGSKLSGLQPFDNIAIIH